MISFRQSFIIDEGAEIEPIVLDSGEFETELGERKFANLELRTIKVSNITNKGEDKDGELREPSVQQ